MSKIGQSLTSMEVSQMVGKDHSKLLRDIRKYSEQLGEAKIGLSDFFTESTYITEQNKTMPCFLVTKKGCEFIAHKLTGQKGTEFTARYINRFHEMEHELNNDSNSTQSMEGLGKVLEVMERTMVNQDADPNDIAKVMKSMLNQFGIRVRREFIKKPELSIRGYMGVKEQKRQEIMDILNKIDSEQILIKIYTVAITHLSIIQERGGAA